MVSIKDLVSVIVPVYNTKNQISKCLNSIVQQSYKKLELIIVDDGSNDGTEDILRKFNEQHYRIRLITNISSSGSGGSARNIGLKEAKGEFLVFVDSDDWLEKEFINDAVVLAKKNKAEVVMADGFYSHDKNGNVRTLRDIGFSSSGSKRDIEIVIREHSSFCTQVWLKLYSTDFIRTNAILFDEVKVSNDVLFSLLVLFRSKKIVKLDGAYYHWIEGRAGSTTNSRKGSASDDVFDAYYNLIRSLTYDEMKDYGLLCIERFMVSFLYSLEFLDHNLRVPFIDKAKAFLGKLIEFDEDLVQIARRNNKSYDYLYNGEVIELAASCNIDIGINDLHEICEIQSQPPVKISQKPKISVIIPIYNAEKFIYRCITNVLNQSIQDIEIICVDNGSSDYSLNILERFQEVDGRLILSLENEKGAGAARNKGLQIARGDYVIFHDADDYYPESDCLEILYSIIEEKKRNLVRGNWLGLRPNGTEYKATLTGIEIFTDEDIDVNWYDDCRLYTFWGHWTYLFKRSFLVENDLKYPLMARGQDSAFMAEVFQKLDEPVYWSSKVVFQYRQEMADGKQKWDLRQWSNTKLEGQFLFYKYIKDLLVGSGFNNIWYFQQISFFPYLRSIWDKIFLDENENLFNLVKEIFLSTEDVASKSIYPFTLPVLEDYRSFQRVILNYRKGSLPLPIISDYQIKSKEVCQNYRGTFYQEVVLPADKSLRIANGKYKIVCLSTTLDSTGVPRVAQLLANLFAQYGHKVSLVAPISGQGDFYPIDFRIEVVKRNYGEELNQYISSCDADIILDHRFFHLNRCEEVLDIAIEKGIKYILLHHHSYFRFLTYLASDVLRVNELGFFLDLIRIYRKMTTVVALTSQVAYSFGINIKNVTSIPNATTYSIDSDKRSKLSNRTIVSVGRFNNIIKRIDLLLIAFSKIKLKYPDAHLVLVGKYDLNLKVPDSNKTIGELYSEMNFTDDDVSWIGESQDVSEYYSNASVYMHTSDMEGLPLVFIEAAMAGLPRVAFEYQGIDEVITDGEDGFIIPRGDIRALVDKVSSIFDDKELRLRLGRNAVSSSDKFLPEHILTQWNSLFNRAMSLSQEELNSTLSSERVEKTDYNDALVYEYEKHLNYTAKCYYSYVIDSKNKEEAYKSLMKRYSDMKKREEDHMLTIESKTSTIDSITQELKEKNASIIELTAKLGRNQEYINEITDNKWFRFGQYSRRRKLWTILKTIVKRFWSIILFRRLRENNVR